MGERPTGRAFKTAATFRAWLAKHHARERELILRCYKVHASEKGIGYKEGLDEALCFGWIDGVRRGLDADSFTVRLTPRKSKSYWSAVNVRHYARLVSEGRMRAPGRRAYEARANRSGSTKYSFESRTATLTPAYARRLRANPRAWTFFQAQPPWYRRTSQHWVMGAKREETRIRRLATLIADSAAGRTIKPLTRPVRPKPGRKHR